MELLGMLQHFASWHFLAAIAMLDVCFIFLRLTGPAGPGLPSLLPSPHPRAEEARHARLLERVAEERGRLGEEMRLKVAEMRNITRTLRLRAEVLASLDRSMGRLEDSIQRLQGGGGGGGREEDSIQRPQGGREDSIQRLQGGGGGGREEDSIQRPQGGRKHSVHRPKGGGHDDVNDVD